MPSGEEEEEELRRRLATLHLEQLKVKRGALQAREAELGRQQEARRHIIEGRDEAQERRDLLAARRHVLAADR
jgi:hypothetical protein